MINRNDASSVDDKVRGIWSQALQKPSLEHGDDFFAQGGNSLLAMRTIARIRAALSCQVSLFDLLENPTLGSFTEIVRQRASR